MKLSAILALSVAALVSAQVPKGGGPPKGPPKGSGGMPKGSGGGMPKGGAGGGFPKGGAGGFPGACAASCLAAPMQSGSCKLTGVFPPKGGAGGAGGMPGGMPGGMGGMGGAGGMPGMSGMGGMPKGGAPPKPPTLVARQADGTSPPKPTSPPKGSLTPEQSSAIASARSCFCTASALKSAIENCVPSACATASDQGAGAAKMINGICKNVSGFTPVTPPPAAAPAATPAPTPA